MINAQEVDNAIPTRTLFLEEIIIKVYNLTKIVTMIRSIKF